MERDRDGALRRDEAKRSTSIVCAGRRAGSFSRQRITRAAKAEGIPGRACQSGTGTSIKWACMISVTPRPAKGAYPANISYAITPSAYKSAR